MTDKFDAIIVGAGIAGAAAAYFLSTRHGLQRIAIVEAGDPLSLTSDKSTECYRNWWPGPGSTMVDFSNRSIDLLEELSLATGERFSMNRRGYAFATADEATVDTLRQSALEAEGLGAGKYREHSGRFTSGYPDHRPFGWQSMPTGMDLLLAPDLIHRQFPGVSADTRAVLHVRRCGWIRAQQLGSFFLEQAREAGTRLVRGEVVDIDVQAGTAQGVRVLTPEGEERTLCGDCVVLSPGPGLGNALDMIGVNLPISYECHVKVALKDSTEAMHPSSPLLLWMDPVTLPWSADESALLGEDEATQYLVQPFPAGVHGRPEGARENHHALMLWTYDIEPVEPTFPIQHDPHLPEIIVRGMSRMLPGMKRYFDPLPKIPVDGGYYTKTPENRPLVGPSGVDGVFINAAYSGFGIMTACAGGELLAKHVTGDALPSYAPALSPARFDDPRYLDAFEGAADAGQM